MGTTKLSQYNRALGHLGASRLHPSSGLNENRDDRRELDARWATTCDEMLELGIWRFALRSFEATPDASIDPAFGLQYAYPMPSDFKGLHKIAIDERFTTEDRSYEREGSTIYSEHSKLYMSIVSNDSARGLDLGKWPELFSEAHGLLLANKVCVAITKDQNLETKLLTKFERVFLPRAKRKDAVDERVKEKPGGSWVRARFASGSGNNDRRED